MRWRLQMMGEKAVISVKGLSKVCQGGSAVKEGDKSIRAFNARG